MAEEDEKITVPVLGRSIKLGQFYDYCRDSFDTETGTLSEKSISKWVTEENLLDNVNETCNHERAFEVLGIDVNTRLNVCLGFVEPSDNVKLLFDHKQESNEGTMLVEQCIKKAKRLDTSKLSNLVSGQSTDSSTHVVTGILYGWERVSQVEGEEENDEPCSKPKTKKKGKEPETIPIRVELLPLNQFQAGKDFQELDETLVMQTVETIQTMNSLEERCEELMQGTNIKAKTILIAEVSVFKSLVIKQVEKIMEYLQDLVPSVREMEEEEEDFGNFVAEIEESPFKSDIMVQWIQNKEQALSVIDEISVNLGPKSFIAAKMGLTAKLKKLGKVCNLQIKVPNKDALIQSMEEYLDDECDNEFDSTELEQTQANQEQLMQTWEQMLEHLKEEGAITGLFSIEKADVSSLECNLRFYVNGKIMNANNTSEDQSEPTASSLPMRKQNIRQQRSGKEKNAPPLRSTRNKPRRSEYEEDSDSSSQMSSASFQSVQKRIKKQPTTDHKVSSASKASKKKVPVALPPEKPLVEDVSHNKVKVEWTPPTTGMAVTEYIIFDEDGEEVVTVDGEETCAEIQIKAKLVPAFTVQADYGEHGTSPHSEASDSYESTLWENTIPTNLVVKQAFGQQFEIGQLYDGRNALILEENIKMKGLKDHIITNECPPGKNSAGTLSYEETLVKLAIDSETLLDILLGFVTPSGAKSLLNGDRDFSEKEFNLQQITTKTRHINPKSIPKTVYKNADSEATHIVAGITYGCDILSCEDGTDPNEEGEIYHDLSQESVEDSRMTKVVADVKKRLKANPSLAVPVKVHLFPIPKREFEPMDTELADGVIAVLNNYQKALDYCSSMESHAKFGKNAALKTKFDAFRKLVTTRKKQFSKRMSSLIPDIRGTSEDACKLEKLLKAENNSPYNQKTMKMWFKMMEEELKFIADIEKQLSGSKKFNSYEEMQEEIVSSRGCLYCLAVFMPVEDKVLKEMSESKQRGPHGKSEDKATNMVTREEAKSALQVKLEVFHHLKQNSKGTDRYVFLICCHNEDFEVTIHQYKDGKMMASDVGFLCKPNKLQEINVTESSIQIEWVYPGNDQPDGYNIIVKNKEGREFRHHSETCRAVIENLTAGSNYRIKICAVNNTMESEFSDELQVTTRKADVTSPPGQPECSEIASHKLQIKWSHPKKISRQIEEYVVHDTTKGPVATVKGTDTSCIFEPRLDTQYQFTVVAHCGQYGRSKTSEASDPIVVKMSDEERRREMATGNATLLPNSKGGPPIYLLKLRDSKTQVLKTRKMEFGIPHDNKQVKTIMLLGATGSGKTTLINGMINYIFGVEWSDNFRVRLIPEEAQSDNQAKSQTSIITSYTIHHQPGFQVPYTLTIVDTPGFGDTSGIGKDREITEQIDTFFRAKGNAGLDHISAIGFVAQSSLARLTVSQRYIFDSILSLFGKDIADNIVPLLTFADGQKPQVLDALEAAKIPHKAFFKFNSSALFVDNAKKSEDDDFDEMFWKMGIKSFNKFFKAVKTMTNKSLTLTKKLLTERETLQLQIEGLNKDINTGITKLHQLDQEFDVLKKYESDIDKNKNFTYTVDEEQVTMEKIPEGTFTTNCLTCRRTCHDDCGFEDDEDKINCIAMVDGNCTVCKGKCLWSEHKNLPHTYNITMVKVTKTAEELKERYKTAKDEKMTKEKIVNGLMHDFEKTHKEVILRSIEAKRCITRIRDIALKPNPLSTSEYVDLMIEGEKNERKSGYMLRIKQLEEVRKTAEIVEKLTKDGYDPFTDQADIIAKVKELSNFDERMAGSVDEAKNNKYCSVM